jgi:predicted Fe-Mo cluster-binding NifX family protein
VNVRLVVPVSDKKGVDSQISQHFGRTPYFAVIDLDENGQIIKQSTVSSSGEHFCEGINFLLNLKPDFMIAQGMGQRVIQNFQNARIAILGTSANVVKDAIQQYNRGELVGLTRGCH